MVVKLLPIRILIFGISGCLALLIFGWQHPSLAQTGKSIFWRGGQFSFSDELGGFGIKGIKGRGTFDDPIVLSIDIESVGQSVLTVRQFTGLTDAVNLNKSWTTLHIKYDVMNNSSASWIGFRFELQEELGTPSIYGDGLSFNQITRDDSNILSDRFAKYEVEHEPGDRLVFNDGWVDQSDRVRFSIFLLDLTPAPVFYIQQIPHLPAS